MKYVRHNPRVYQGSGKDSLTQCDDVKSDGSFRIYIGRLHIVLLYKIIIDMQVILKNMIFYYYFKIDSFINFTIIYIFSILSSHLFHLELQMRQSKMQKKELMYNFQIWKVGKQDYICLLKFMLLFYCFHRNLHLQIWLFWIWVLILILNIIKIYYTKFYLFE